MRINYVGVDPPWFNYDVKGERASIAMYIYCLMPSAAFSLFPLKVQVEKRKKKVKKGKCNSENLCVHAPENH